MAALLRVSFAEQAENTQVSGLAISSYFFQKNLFNFFKSLFFY